MITTGRYTTGIGVLDIYNNHNNKHVWTVARNRTCTMVIGFIDKIYLRYVYRSTSIDRLAEILSIFEVMKHENEHIEVKRKHGSES